MWIEEIGFCGGGCCNEDNKAILLLLFNFPIVFAILVFVLFVNIGVCGNVVVVIVSVSR
jgi:hypothetical protein